MTTQSSYKDVMMKVVNPDGTETLDDTSAPVVKKLSSAGASMIGVRYVNNVAFARFLQGNGF